MLPPNAGAEVVAAALPAAFAARDPAALGLLLREDVRWGGEDETADSCGSRDEVRAYYTALLAQGVTIGVVEAVVSANQVLARLSVAWPAGDGGVHRSERQVRISVRGGLVVDILELDAPDEKPPVLELLYFDGCPNHRSFLPHLRQLLADAGVNAEVRLVRVATDEEAQHLRFLGSPTLRVDGEDVELGAFERRDYGLQCRLYATGEGLRGTPEDATVFAALAAAGNGARAT